MNVLITGGTSGIAYAVALRLDKREYNVYIGVHTETEEFVLRKKLKNHKNIKVLKLDVTLKSDVLKLKEIDIDILYCNAGIGMGGSVAEIPIENMRENFEVNVFGNFFVIQTVLSGMIERGSGRIVIMSSLLGIAPLKFLGVYSATKASIISLTTALRKELRMINKNINVCLIEPGAYHTGFNQIMLNNKYDFMKDNSYFKGMFGKIRRRENLIFNIIEKKQLGGIVYKIEDALISDKPKFIYRAPFLQVVFMKLYYLLFL